MKQRARVLVVDDEPAVLANCRRLLEAEGYECSVLEDARRFRECLQHTRPDVLLLDLRMPDADGMSLLTTALADAPDLPVIIITGHATISSAVHATRAGAFDYLAKPFSADQLLVAIERALRYSGLRHENEALRAQVMAVGQNGILGEHPDFLRLLQQAHRVAQTDASVLIMGESGTGKEVLARFIHAESPRKGRAFIPVDCAALPEGLLESELFGHERGAFTGATFRKDGLLTAANGGTAFLDEITELGATLQSKLLRALEERKIRRLGSSEFMDIDVRIIAATNVDLEAAVASGAFRQDLFYRLNVVPFQMPPLRERMDDVPLLMQAFLRQAAAEMKRDPPRVAPEVWPALERHNWPGNVREVRNLARRLIALDDDDRIRLSDLPDSVRREHLPGPVRDGGDGVWPGAQSGSLPDYATAREGALLKFQSAYVRMLLARHGGNVSQAARAAGVSRRTLHRWLVELRGNGREA